MDPKTLDLVKVEFDYNAENEDELNLKKGQFVIVTKRDDQGWWEGGLVGSDKKGMFPDNFLVRPRCSTSLGPLSFPRKRCFFLFVAVSKKGLSSNCTCVLVES